MNDSICDRLAEALTQSAGALTEAEQAHVLNCETCTNRLLEACMAARLWLWPI